MINLTLVIAVAVTTLLLLIGCFAAGYFVRDMRQSLSALRSRIATLEETDLPEPAIFEAKSPKEVAEHKFEEDEDSAIIEAKPAKQLAREKDQKLNDDLDRLGR